LRTLRVYISEPLTNGRNTAQEVLVDKLAKLCEQKGLEHYVPHEHSDPKEHALLPAEVVYKLDTSEISKSDLLLAYVGLPSLGVGGEIEYARSQGVEVIAVHEKGAKVSRFALGSPAVVEVVVLDTLQAPENLVGAALDHWLERKQAQQDARVAPSVLTNGAIASKLQEHDLRIVDPQGKDIWRFGQDGKFEELECGQLDAHGYEIRAGDLYSWRAGGWVNLKENLYYDVRPGDSVVIRTYERLGLPRNVVGTVHSLAHLTLEGWSHTSTTIHPGWGDGGRDPSPLCVEIHNVGPSLLRICYKDRFCRILLFEARDEATIPAPCYTKVTGRFEQGVKERQRKLDRKRQRLTWMGVGGLAALFLGLVGVFFLVDWAAAIGTLAAVSLAVFLAWVFSERSRFGGKKHVSGTPTD